MNRALLLIQNTVLCISSCAPSWLWHSVIPIAYSPQFSRLWHSVHCAGCPLVANSLTEFATHLQWRIWMAHGARASDAR